jgi:hypothetical protein
MLGLSVFILIFGVSSNSSLGSLVNVTAELSSKCIPLNGFTDLQIKVKGCDATDLPKMINVDGLNVVLTGQSKSVEMINFIISTNNIYYYNITPKRPGSFNIPAIIINIQGKSFQSKPVDLEVVDNNTNTESLASNSLTSKNNTNRDSTQIIPEVDSVNLNKFETYKIKYLCQDFNPVNKPLSTNVVIEPIQDIRIAFVSKFKVEKNYIIYEIKAKSTGQASFEPIVFTNNCKISVKPITISITDNKLVDNDFPLIGGPDQETILKFTPNARQIAKSIKRGKALDNAVDSSIPKNIVVYPIRFNDFINSGINDSSDRTQIFDSRKETDKILNGRIIDDYDSINEEFQIRNSIYFFYQDQFGDWKVTKQ